jgi:hypothetical protein
MYLGSKIFKGTVVLGNIIKLLKGKTGIFLGKSIFCIFNFNIKKKNFTEVLKILI